MKQLYLILRTKFDSSCIELSSWPRVSQLQNHSLLHFQIRGYNYFRQIIQEQIALKIDANHRCNFLLKWHIYIYKIQKAIVIYIVSYIHLVHIEAQGNQPCKRMKAQNTYAKITSKLFYTCQLWKTLLSIKIKPLKLEVLVDLEKLKDFMLSYFLH